MSSRDWVFRIEDILKAINKIESYLDNMTLNQFTSTDWAIDAVIRNFEIIGEASNSIPHSLRNKYPGVPWDEMKGMRNILIHEYFSVDLDTVWKTAKHHLPALKIN